MHHKRAVQILCVTIALDAAFGLLYSSAERIPVLHGLYCALGTATTVGCDISPDNAFGYALMVAMMLTVVPLFAAVFSFFTSGLTSDHVEKVTVKQTEHFTRVTQDQTAELKGHVDVATTGQTAELKDHISR